ncbi:MAG: hypothetical protein DMF79_09935 [Acidobacteria bacterium]|nr:MAG: hypothetical protein DMF79_09935 [Acidobacteriota bacterium]
MADLRPRASRRDPREGVPRQRAPRAGAAVVSAALLLAASLAAGEAGYTVGRAEAPRATLLGPAEEAWSKAERITWGPEKYETAFRALWDEAGLYVRFDARDPDPWSTMTRRDEHLWEEEVVEIFLDLDRSGKDYAEVEVSPANVICDVRMVAPSPNKESDLSWNLGRPGQDHRLESRRLLPLERLPDAAVRAHGQSAPEAGRPVALQRVPHRAPAREERTGEGRGLRRLVPPWPAELPRPRGVPRLRVRR